MSFICGQTWQPRRIDRVIETYSTSTRPAKVMTDQGLAILKGMGNPAGDSALACEVVATELASAIGLRVANFAIVPLNLPVPMREHGTMRQGPAFVSSLLSGQTMGAQSLFQRLSRPGDIAKIVFLDSWVRNEDRFPPVGSLMTSGNLDNLFFTPAGAKFDLVALDHSHCFTLGNLCEEIGTLDVRDDTRVHGLFDEFRPFLTEAHVLSAAAAVKAVSMQQIEDILNLLPEEWGIGRSCRKMWADVIGHRAGLVAQALTTQLIGQLRLEL